MNDGHTGLSNQGINQGESGHFKLVLSCLKQGSGRAEYILHVNCNLVYGFRLPPSTFLSQIGLTQYHGQCPFTHGNCFYQVIGEAPQSFHGMEHYSQIRGVHDSFTNFVNQINQLFQLCDQEEKILNEIGLKPAKHVLFGPPVQIVIQETDIPIWVNEVKFPRLLQLEEQRGLLQTEIDQLNQFLPLLYGTGNILETAVIHALRFLGLEAEKTEKGFTADIRAQTSDGSKKFGLEVTGINGQVKKDSPKLNQVTQFELIKEYEEKVILVANTHNKTPISQRKSLDDFTPQVLTFFERHPVLLMTSWNLYCMVRDVLDGTQIKEELIDVLYTSSGKLNYGS